VKFFGETEGIVMTDVSVPAPAKSGPYHAEAIILYGVKLNATEDYGSFDMSQGSNAELRVQLFRAGDAQTKQKYSVVLAYGYAFEGHCYRFDANRIFIVTGPAGEPAVGCGFDALPGAKESDPSYQMWRIRASTDLLEVAVNFDDAKTLILDANLPGKRSPTSYAITQSMAHRNGRLSRD
jgi:hypothetical protein